ncbi:hypothetical protein ACFL1W_01615, partial [Candidatus Margulisiibacteriota bacterium]
LVASDLAAGGLPDGVSVDSGAKTITWDDQVGAGEREIYFKGCIAGQAAVEGPLGLSGNLAVGKVNVDLKQEYNCVTYPFNAATYTLAEIIGDQLKEGDQLHWWDVGEWDEGSSRWTKQQAYYAVTKLAAWPDGEFKPAEGFYVYLLGKSRDEKLTLVGKVGGFAVDFELQLSKEYTLTGYPYPRGGLLATSIGFMPREGDQFHKWDWATQGFIATTYLEPAGEPAGWRDEEITRFKLGEGKFYYILPSSPTYKWKPEF